MRYFLALFALMVLTVMVVAGRRGPNPENPPRKPPIEIFPDMDRQPKLRPEAPNNFFPDGLSSQKHIEGTIARGSAFEDVPYNTGKITGTTNWVETIPVPVTVAMLKRGQQRFSINCSPCHGSVGDGKGITTKYGMVAVANFHDPRLVQMTDGEIFNTITHGKNLMGSYGANITIDDRWAIISYVRALQRSQLGVLDDVPQSQRAVLNK
ncbi:MAG TPA: cytochrome c [Roseimicrobium sp.]|nr:cytochrome c [Roseimicrobium sp.]